jgi:hypothetical protein
MAVEEDAPSTSGLTPLELSKLVDALEEKWGGPIELKFRPSLKEMRFLPDVQSPKFDRLFFRDFLAGLGLSAVTIVAAFLRVPVLGDPLALLLGPVVILLLGWRHRP